MNNKFKRGDLVRVKTKFREYIFYANGSNTHLVKDVPIDIGTILEVQDVWVVDPGGYYVWVPTLNVFTVAFDYLLESANAV